MEWFDKPADPRKPGHYISASDVYPHVMAAAQQVAVTSPRLPANAVALAVYVQLPQINPATSISVTISDSSLVLVKSP